MKVYTYSQARQNLAEVLNQSKDEQVIIRRRGGESFAIVPKPREGSPFDVPGVKTKADTADILDAVRESRRGQSPQRPTRRSKAAGK
jgi:prevent-host-death family protein